MKYSQNLNAILRGQIECQVILKALYWRHTNTSKPRIVIPTRSSHPWHRREQLERIRGRLEKTKGGIDITVGKVIELFLNIPVRLRINDNPSRHGVRAFCARRSINFVRFSRQYSGVASMSEPELRPARRSSSR